MTAPKPLPLDRYPTEKTVDRPAYAAGLRHLATLVEDGSLPIPYGALDLFLAFGSTPLEEQPAAARDLMRAIGGGRWAKDSSGNTMAFDGMCGGVPVRIYVARDAVCERVVVGTETVEVPAQPAVEAHTQTREVVDWRCAPLLAAAESADAIEVDAAEVSA